MIKILTFLIVAFITTTVPNHAHLTNKHIVTNNNIMIICTALFNIFIYTYYRYQLQNA